MTDMEDGITIVRAARGIVEAEAARRTAKYDPRYNGYAGVFVTLKTHPDGELRGCIGYPEPVYPLSEALFRAAKGVCHDPRFPPLSEHETEKVTVEVTILSPPSLLTGSKDEIMRSIVIGRDGLMMESPWGRGLLLPQVPVEWNWDVTEYLESLSRKAGRRKDAWKDEDSKIYSFTGEIFSETVPNGEIERG